MELVVSRLVLLGGHLVHHVLGWTVLLLWVVREILLRVALHVVLEVPLVVWLHRSGWWGVGTFTKLIKNLKEVLVVNNIIKACSEQIHKLHKLTGLDTSYIFKNHIHKVISLDDSGIRYILLPKLAVQLHLLLLLHIVDLFKYQSSFRVLQDDLFFQKPGILTSEWILLVPLQTWLAKVMLSLANHVHRRLLLSVKKNLVMWVDLVHRGMRYLPTAIKLPLFLQLYCVLPIFLAVLIDVMVGQVLSTESTHQLKLFEFLGVPVHESGPLVHLVPGLLVELILEEIVFLFQFLVQLLNNVVLHL